VKINICVVAVLVWLHGALVTIFVSLEKKHFTSFMWVTLRRIYCLQLWMLLRRENTRDIVSLVSTTLKGIALDIFVKAGRRSNRACLVGV
jgi:hypothetical protein